MTNKLRVLLLFGGQSGEHEVSIVSATHVKKALDLNKYDIQAVGITKRGEWFKFPETLPLTALDDPSNQFKPALLMAGPSDKKYALKESLGPIDVVIPILHGPMGEDGTVQGFLELTGLPYVGCGVLASAVAMDKVTTKRILRDVGIKVVNDQLILSAQLILEREPTLERIEHKLAYPMFVKPSNLGSSVGVSKANNRTELAIALNEAAKYDRRILVEEAVPNTREIEVAVLGNYNIQVSIPGEVVPDREFYDYDSKYSSESKSELKIPAQLSSTQMTEIQTMAEKAFRAIDGAGMSRVDFLINEETGEIFLNEINTIPGFTPISMYPKLWEASGISYSQLLDKLIELALERSKEKIRLALYAK